MRRTRRGPGISLGAAGLLAATLACATPTHQYHSEKGEGRRYLTDERNYTFAIYNQSNDLITYPIADLRRRMRADPPITDVFVVAHGWNYTVPEAVANYYRYIDLYDQHMDPAIHESFRPFFIFVAWPSVIRPAGDAARAILPFQLDRAIEPITRNADEWIFRLPTAWKQSLNAYTIALGRHSPSTYREWAWDDVRPEARLRSPDIGRDLPVSCMIHELLVRSGSTDAAPPVRLHLLGHSYGAKVLALSAVEALRRHSAETGKPIARDRIESLIMFSPVFHPRELLYVADFEEGAVLPTIVPEKDLDTALRSIPRKAVVYSKFDYPGGPIFALSQLLLNNQQVQTAQATMNHVTDRIEASGPMSRHWNKVIRPVAGVGQLGSAVVQAPVQAGAGLVTDLVPELAASEGEPVEVRGATLRPGLAGVGPLERYVAGEGRRDSAAFLELSRTAGATGSAPPLRRDQILSFDATPVFNRRAPLEGAHTELGAHEEVDVGEGPLEKRVYTFNFLFNLILCLPTDAHPAREFCRARSSAANSQGSGALEG